jgi:hypothetical protein
VPPSPRKIHQLLNESSVHCQKCFVLYTTSWPKDLREDVLIFLVIVEISALAFVVVNTVGILRNTLIGTLNAVKLIVACLGT